MRMKGRTPREPGTAGTERNEAATPEPDVTLHRVRVGITGLAVVFLLTVLAAALFSLLGHDDHGTTRLANGSVVANSTLPAEAPKEPLAELGVAPGNMPDNVAAPAAPRAPARRPAPPAHP